MLPVCAVEVFTIVGDSMEKRKVIRKKRRVNLGIRRSIATFLTIAMLSAASMSAVAFAVNADVYDDAVVTEEAVVYTPVVEAPEVEAPVVEAAPEAEVADEPAAEALVDYYAAAVVDTSDVVVVEDDIVDIVAAEGATEREVTLNLHFDLWGNIEETITFPMDLADGDIITADTVSNLLFGMNAADLVSAGGLIVALEGGSVVVTDAPAITLNFLIEFVPEKMVTVDWYMNGEFVESTDMLIWWLLAGDIITIDDVLSWTLGMNAAEFLAVGIVAELQGGPFTVPDADEFTLTVLMSTAPAMKEVTVNWYIDSWDNFEGADTVTVSLVPGSYVTLADVKSWFPGFDFSVFASVVLNGDPVIVPTGDFDLRVLLVEDPYQPGGTTPQAPLPPADGDDDADDADDGDDTDANERRPATGPQTGDANNWFAQIAALSVLVVTIATAGLFRTRTQN